jgi:protein O-mannosyl-transferase
MKTPRQTVVSHERRRGLGFFHWLARARVPLVCLLLAAVTLVLFRSVVGFDYVNYDDEDYVTANPHVQGGLTAANVAWAFTTGHSSNWHPLTWISHMLDVELFGKGPAGPHFVNLLFHVANTLLLFLLLRQLTGAFWRSAWVAALFALHPLHVESVAWISERKDVLSAFFGFLTLLAYVGFVRNAEGGGRWTEDRAEDERQRPVAGGQQAQGANQEAEVSDFRPPSSVLCLPSRGHYWLALLLFALGLMCKPMLVTLPFVMLLLDYWPLGRLRFSSPADIRSGFKRVGLEKVPFVALSAASCVVTFLVQKEGGSVQSLGQYPIALRIENAFVSYARYLARTIWPSDLAIYYPYPAHWVWPLVAFGIVLVAGFSWGALRLGRKHPYAVTGWFWYWGMLIPVIGLVQAGSQSLADRYTYMPLVGVFIVLAWGAGEAFARWRVPAALAGLAAALPLVACAARTTDQVLCWRDSDTLYRQALSATRDNDRAHYNLACYLRQQGRIEEAIYHCREAIRINPCYAKAWCSLGLMLGGQGKLDEAIRCFAGALSADTNYASAYDNLGFALAARGDFAQAIENYQKALRIEPGNPEVYNNLGNALLAQGKLDEAMTNYRRALGINPRFGAALSNLGVALDRQGKPEEAIRQFAAALRVEPDSARAHFNLGCALARARRLDEAVDHYRSALRIDPDSPETHLRLGVALAELKCTDKAIGELNEALRLKPDYPEARRQLESLEGQRPN